jgi:hypothetical protein
MRIKGKGQEKNGFRSCRSLLDLSKIIGIIEIWVLSYVVAILSKVYVLHKNDSAPNDKDFINLKQYTEISKKICQWDYKIRTFSFKVKISLMFEAINGHTSLQQMFNGISVK